MSGIVISRDQYIQLSSCHNIIINNNIDMHNIALRVTCGTANVHCNSKKKKYLYNDRLNNKLLYDNGKKSTSNTNTIISYIILNAT